MSKQDMIVKSAVLIEPDHDEPSPKRQRLCPDPSSVVSALLSLSKSTEYEEKIFPWPDSVSSLPILGPNEGEEDDGNHVSDDEDEYESCRSTKRPLSKPILSRWPTFRSVPSCVVEQRDYSCNRALKDTPTLQLPLPIGRPLAAAPGLPSLALGEKMMFSKLVRD